MVICQDSFLRSSCARQKNSWLTPFLLRGEPVAVSKLDLQLADDTNSEDVFFTLRVSGWASHETPFHFRHNGYLARLCGATR